MKLNDLEIKNIFLVENGNEKQLKVYSEEASYYAIFHSNKLSKQEKDNYVF